MLIQVSETTPNQAAWTEPKGTFKGGWQAFLKDPRNFQIVFHFTFLMYGLIYLGWSAEWMKLGTIFAVALGTQAILAKMTGAPLTSLKSALITALGLAFLFKANSIWTVAFAAFVSIASKFFIKVKGKHVFNPSVFGIVAGITLTGDAWISPGQWGNDFTIIFFFAGAALMMLLKVGRIDVSLAFLGTFAGLEFIRTVLYYGWPMDHFLHQFTTGSILLFAFFMITDPVSTPSSKTARIIWAALVGILAWVLTAWFYVFTAPIWALFLISPVTVLLDRVFLANKFQWIRK